MSVAWARDVPAGVDVAVAALEGESLAVMLYGSHARGDAGPESDVDLLQLVRHSPRSYIAGSTTVVSYTPEQLQEMSAEGSLFAWHLRIEGVVLRDSEGILRSLLRTHPGPACERALGRIRRLSAILDMDQAEFESYANRAIRTARYLVRTAVYARSLEAGGTSFAMDIAAEAAGCPHLRVLLRRGLESADDWGTFVAYRSALVELIGELEQNPFGSLEALAVRSWTSDPQLASLSIQTLVSRDGEIAYSTLPPPVL